MGAGTPEEVEKSMIVAAAAGEGGSNHANLASEPLVMDLWSDGMI